MYVNINHEMYVNINYVNINDKKYDILKYGLLTH